MDLKGSRRVHSLGSSQSFEIYFMYFYPVSNYKSQKTGWNPIIWRMLGMLPEQLLSTPTWSASVTNLIVAPAIVTGLTSSAYLTSSWCLSEYIESSLFLLGTRLTQNFSQLSSVRCDRSCRLKMVLTESRTSSAKPAAETILYQVKMIELFSSVCCYMTYKSLLN